MRPKKNVLLYCGEEEERSRYSFLLWLRGYNVLGAITQYSAGADLALVIDDRTLETVTAAEAIVSLNPTLPLFVMPHARRIRIPDDQYPAHAQLLPLQCSTATMLGRIRIALARKHGPKRQAVPA